MAVAGCSADLKWLRAGSSWFRGWFSSVSSPATSSQPNGLPISLRRRRFLRLLQPIPPPSSSASTGSAKVGTTMMMARRRFVNVVAENVRSGLFSVHRLNVSEHLFYPSTAEAEVATPAQVGSRLVVLPAPATSFQPAPALLRRGQFFALMSPRSSESRILWSNPEHILLYDVESHSTYALPRLSYMGRNPITLSISRPDAPEDDLYVMSAGTDYTGFEVLKFGRPSNPKVNLLPNAEMWQLESLPQPPLPKGARICSHAVLHDGRTICITWAALHGGTGGTYLFDTLKREWSRAPNDWDLPFSSGAQHVPNLKLWLGLCSSRHHLCASADLSISVDERKLPTLKHQWEIVETPEEWLPIKVSVINLGDGRFCIFKLIHDVVPEFDDFSYRGNLRKRLALLTGVEIISSPEEQGGLRMVAHKSLSCICAEWIDCVL